MHEKREISVAIRLNDDEAHRLDIARRTVGLDRSSYIRMAMLEKLHPLKPPPAPPKKKRR